jgi:dipeptidyl aminopeptidase/acylaminoacyl peptidase
MVHEYGGQSYAVRDGVVVFSNFEDQRLYLLDRDGVITPLTAEPATPRSVRFADHNITPDGRWVVCVRERHGIDGVEGALGVVNDIVAIPLNTTLKIVVLAQGNDFYLAPRLSPDGRRLAYLTWNHPNMPWDGTELFVADLDESLNVTGSSRVAGGVNESISQPTFRRDGVLVYLSDRTGFWNLYDEKEGPLFPIEAECGGPDWVFGQSSYVHADNGEIIVAYTRNAKNQLVIVNQEGARELDLRLTNFSSLALTDSGDLIALGASASDPLAVLRIDLADGATRVVRTSRELSIDPAYISTPRHFSFPTTDGLEAYALYYPPKNQDFQGAPGERPPLIVQSHGGPTANARQIFDPEIQFWTSRGFAVVDVDYGGSTGYGRAYRERLNGRWGIVDVDDCTNAALHLASRGRVNPRHMVIHGGSAGGYTTLACLVFRHVFAAGASYFGVSDLAALAADTHKFESRYLDRLIGPYPEAKEVYEARSPLKHASDLKVPVIFFQGLDDRIVPPNQAQMMVDALHVHGIPAAYLTFAGEGHGFRGAEAITRSIEAELYFYSRVLDLTVSDTIEPVPIVDSLLLIH